MSKRILVIHGPNLNLLGKRETSIYGDLDYDELNRKIEEKGAGLGLSVIIRQSNHEGAIVDIIQKAPEEADCIIINPGGYTHTSISIRDAITAIDLPVIEVHLSNIYNREEFRSKSYISDVAAGSIVGFGAESYLLALEAASSL